MPQLLLIVAGVGTVLQGLFGYFLLQKIWFKRLTALERDLQQFSEVMCQMAEIQMKSYRKLNGNLGEIEERIMDLALPSDDSSHQLERRHQVLALARKGVPIDEIIKRLNVPRGEAELILNLRKFVDVGTAGTGKGNKTLVEVKRYAEV
jgi:hypothetical protein